MNDQEMLYRPVKCWKCGTVGNAAKPTICARCGVALRAALRTDGSLREPGKGAARAVRLGFAVMAACVVIPVAAVSLKTFRGGTFATPRPNAIAIPKESWFQPGLTNLYRQQPTAREVIDKNTAASGQGILADEPHSTILTGELYIAIGDCANEKCVQDKVRLEEQRRAERDAFYANKPGTRTSYPMTRQPTEAPAIVISDYFLRGNYTYVGTIDVYAQRPDSVFTRTTVNVPNNAGAKVVTSKAFDGTRGWQREAVFDAFGRAQKDEQTELDPLKIAELKRQTSEIWNQKFLDGRTKYDDIAMVGNEPCWVLSRALDDGTTGQYYFDSQTGYLVKSDIKGVATYFAEYHDFEGSMIPGKMYIRRLELEGFHSWTQIVVDRWSMNVDINNKIFESGL